MLPDWLVFFLFFCHLRLSQREDDIAVGWLKPFIFFKNFSIWSEGPFSLKVPNGRFCFLIFISNTKYFDLYRSTFIYHTCSELYAIIDFRGLKSDILGTQSPKCLRQKGLQTSSHLCTPLSDPYKYRLVTRYLNRSLPEPNTRASLMPSLATSLAVAT